MKSQTTTYCCERCGQEESELHQIAGKFVCPACSQTTIDALQRAQAFTVARASAGVLCQGPEMKFKPGWFPRLAGEFVRNADDPQHGYETRDDALAAARRWRASAKAAIMDRSAESV